MNKVYCNVILYGSDNSEKKKLNTYKCLKETDIIRNKCYEPNSGPRLVSLYRTIVLLYPQIMTPAIRQAGIKAL